MKYLLHCIFRESAPAIPECCAEAAVLSSRGLAAAVTLCRDDALPPAVVQLLAYEKIIARFHAARTVIPFRFGCVREGESGIRQFLEEHLEECRQILARLDGLGEMSLRAWWPPPAETVRPATRGVEYLAAARRRQADLTRTEESWAGCVCGSLAGCYVDERREARPAAAGRLVSLHFLTPRSAAEEIRERVRETSSPTDVKLLISGPWPPYHFVDHAFR
jgi:Gas vesicle synthesis protein GvpL/GvpF